MRRSIGWICAGAAGVLVTSAVVGQDSSTGQQAPLRHSDSVTLRQGKGGHARITLPGGDMVIPGDGAQVSTLTQLDAEGAARTQVNLEGGSFKLEGRGGGPRIQVLGLGVVPGTGNVHVTVDGSNARIEHAEGGPVVLRLGTSPDAASVVLTEGGAVDIYRTGSQFTVSVVDRATGRVLLSEARGWSRLAPDTVLDAGADPANPQVTRGEAVGGAKPPEVPTPEPVSGSEEMAARLGQGGNVTLIIADGSKARAESGAEVVARWSGGPADRQATLVTTSGTMRASLRTPRTTAETPAHRIGAADAASITMTVNAEGERIEIGRDGAGATITNALPHQGPAIQIAVGPGDAIEYVAGDPAQGIRYRIPLVRFLEGGGGSVAGPAKGAPRPAGPDALNNTPRFMSVEELFRFAFAPETLLPSVRVPYTGLPDLLPPPPVSPSTP